MRKLFVSICILISTGACSQNAYYDMREMVKWSRLSDTSQEKLQKAETILVKLLKYSGSSNVLLKDSSNLFIRSLYYKADSLYSFSKRYMIPREVILQTIIANQSNIASRRKRDSNDVRIIPNITKYILARKEDSVRFEIFVPFKKKYVSALANFRHGNNSAQLKDAIANAILALKDSLSGMNLGIEDFNQRFGSVTWSLMNTDTDNFDSAYKLIIDPIAEYIRLIEDFPSILLNRIQSHNDQVYHFTMRLSSELFLDIFTQLKLQPEEVNKAMKDEEQLRAKSFIEEQKFANASEGSSPQRLADLNFPTQSDIIDAIAIYLARRAKQEAALLFIEKLSRAIKSDDLAQTLFPETWKVMQMEEAYVQPRFGSSWRNAIATDYISLPQNMGTYISTKVPNGTLSHYFADAVTFGTYVSKKYNFIDIVRTLYSDHSKMRGKWTSIGVDVLYILNQELYDTSRQRYWISPQSFFDLSPTELFCLYDLVRIKYRNTVGGELKSLFANTTSIRTNIEKGQRFYTELLTILQQFYVAQSLPVKSADGSVVIRDGFWDTQRSLVDFLLNQEIIKLTEKERRALAICQQTFYIYDYISNKNYIAAADHVVDIVGQLTQNSKQKLVNFGVTEMTKLRNTQPDLYNLAVRSNTLFSEVLLIKQIRDSIEINPSAKLARQFFINRFDFDQRSFIIDSLVGIGNVNPVVIDSLVHRINRMDAFHTNNLVAIYKTFRQDLSDLKDATKKNIGELDKKKLLYRGAALTSSLLENASLYSTKENASYFKWLTDFSSFLTDIANTRDAVSLANVVESYAMPTGSYRMKRNSNFSIDVNAYVGAYGGLEKIKGDSVYRGVYGVTAPIGLSFSWGTRRAINAGNDDLVRSYVNRSGKLKYRTQNSFTFDLTFLDLGAVVSYRLVNGENKGLPDEVKWSQVLSYGVTARWGIRSTPLCIGVGFQKTPELRSFNNELRDATRFHLSLAFDLPLFNIYRSR